MLVIKITFSHPSPFYYRSLLFQRKTYNRLIFDIKYRSRLVYLPHLSFSVGINSHVVHILSKTLCDRFNNTSHFERKQVSQFLENSSKASKRRNFLSALIQMIYDLQRRSKKTKEWILKKFRITFPYFQTATFYVDIKQLLFAARLLSFTMFLVAMKDIKRQIFKEYSGHCMTKRDIYLNL